MNRGRIFAALALMLVLLAIILLRGGSVSNQEEAARGTHTGETQVTGIKPASTRNALPSSSAQLKVEVPPQGNMKTRGLPELRELLNGKLKSMEAARISLLAEKSIGDLKAYLIDVTPPSPEEIKELRSLLASLQKECPKEEQQRWDSEVEELLREYDGFAEKGRKVIVMRVDEKKDDDLKGYVFWGIEPEELKRQFEAGNTISGMNEGRFYTDSKEALKRFREIVTSE